MPTISIVHGHPLRRIRFGHTCDDILLMKEVFAQNNDVKVHQHAEAKHGYMLQSQQTFNPDAYDAAIASIEEILRSLVT